jgi:DNA polymerase delta subunit 1
VLIDEFGPRWGTALLKGVHIQQCQQLLLLLLLLLPQVLTSQGLATFSLVDCCHSLLNRTLEVIPSHTLAALQQQLAATLPADHADSANASSFNRPVHDVVGEGQLPGIRAGLRLARYSLGRCAAVADFMARLATVPEVFEMARATGLTLEQVGGDVSAVLLGSMLGV